MTTSVPCAFCTATFDSPRAARRHEITVHYRVWLVDVLAGGNEGVCPRCRRLAFLGHGPLCADCFTHGAGVNGEAFSQSPPRGAVDAPIEPKGNAAFPSTTADDPAPAPSPHPDPALPSWLAAAQNA